MAQQKTEDNHFRQFAKSLEKEIAKYGDPKGGALYERQRKQIEGLLALEEQFRVILIAHPWGPNIYKEFIEHICTEKGNILTARPFFRERVKIFTKHISQALKVKDFRYLYNFHFNYQFVHFVMRIRDWTSPEAGEGIGRLAKAIEKARTELIEINLPLAIHRSRIFYSRIRNADLEYMDFIQIATEGLIAGIDKYVTPDSGFSNVFRSVAIGRMVGNFIDEHSSTSVHFYPNDKKKIYRTRKIIGRHNDAAQDFKYLAQKLNEQEDEDRLKKGLGPLPDKDKATPDEISGLMAAASCVSANTTTETDPEVPEAATIERFAADAEGRPDYMVEERQAMMNMADAIELLSVFDKKLLRLRGLDI